MRYIGIDVAKKSLAVWISDKEYLTVSNEAEGFKKILSRLQKEDIIGLESTGNYHKKLAHFFIGKGFIVKELNPIVTKQFIRATVRKKKTDKTDSEIISKLLSQGEGHIMTQKCIENTLKKLCRVRTKLIRNRASIKLQLNSLEGEVFSIKSAQKAFKKIIKSFDKQIEELTKEIEKIETSETKILESIPGISPQIARMIFAELGDVHRFSSVRKIVAFGGYDPKLKASGSSIHFTGKLTKRGTPYLRYILFRAVFSNLRKNTIFSRYYKKKKEEGKHFYQAMTAASRKMLEIIYALLKSGECYRETSLDLS